MNPFLNIADLLKRNWWTLSCKFFPRVCNTASEQRHRQPAIDNKGMTSCSHPLDEIAELLIVNMPKEFSPDSKVAKMLDRLFADDGRLDRDSVIEVRFLLVNAYIRSHFMSTLDQSFDRIPMVKWTWTCLLISSTLFLKL